jgi:selenocysteine lyase/cysteine desulfurase
MVGVEQGDAAASGDVREARRWFPATDTVAYFNTAAVGLASRMLATAYHRYVDEWTATGPEYVRGEAAGERARSAVAALIGADPSDVALIASVVGRRRPRRGTVQPGRHGADELKRRGIVCSARDGNLRLAIHFYNHEDDIRRVTNAVSEIG